MFTRSLVSRAKMSDSKEQGEENAMGSLRGEDGDGRPPPDNGGLPDLPPEWGVVVIPDDLHELEHEASEIRRQNRRRARQERWRRRLRLAPKAEGDSPPVGIPLLIMCVAIIAALTSLFAITFTTRPAPDTTPSAAAPAPAFTEQMIDLALTNASGKPVRLREDLPAVLLLLDGCPCATLIQDTAASAPTKVSILVVDKSAPFIPIGTNAVALADPEQALLATYADGPDREATPAGVPTAVLVNSQGTVTATISPALSVTSFQSALAKLR
jgi:hypothetical protein